MIGWSCRRWSVGGWVTPLVESRVGVMARVVSVRFTLAQSAVCPPLCGPVSPHRSYLAVLAVPVVFVPCHQSTDYTQKKSHHRKTDR